MNAYEEMKNQILLNLTDRTQLTAEEIRKVISEIDRAAAGYEITKKPTEIILPEEAAPRLVRQYIACKMMQGMSELTTENYKRTLVQFFRYVKKPPEQVEANDIRMYLYDYQTRPGKTVSQATVNNYLRYIKYFFSWCQDSDLISRNPADNLGTIKVPKVVKDVFSDVDMEMLRRNCENVRDRAIVAFLASTGCRVSEMCSLNRDQVDLNNRECVVHGKGDKERTVYMDSVTALLIRNYLETRKDGNEALFVTRLGVRFKEGGIRDMLKRLEGRSGVSHVHPHKFRRTYATNMARRGMKIQVIARLMGHDKIETTMTYVMLYKEDIKHDYQHYYAS